MSVPDRYQPIPGVRLRHPEWSASATIYQLNTRQFSPEGTFAAAAAHLPRLQALGVTIVWLMPVNPIGDANRKGPLGSPYAVKDYYAINPEFGTLSDLRDFVATAHTLGMYVILDWVANHTAWDNHLTVEHPDWYVRNWKGDFTPTPWWDWDDIIDLDYSKPELRQYMTDAMSYWLREADLDGFRCDVAGFVPTDFWENVRAELDDIKPVFMLAEWESRDLHAHAFDMTYAWSWEETMHQICRYGADLTGLHVYYSWNEKAFPLDSIRMMFVTNHDKNAWEGTEYERFGDGLEAAIVLSVVGDGMPLIYNGQEAGNRKRLPFFDRDPISWREDSHGELYRKLFALKHSTSALWNGRHGARMVDVPNSAHDRVLSFVRADANASVFAVFNFSPDTRTVTFPQALPYGDYTDFTTGDPAAVDTGTEMVLAPWAYRVLLGRGRLRPLSTKPVT